MKQAHPRQVTNYIKTNIPLYSPDVRKWLDNGGTLTIETTIDGKQVWTYTKGGDSVPYIDGYVKFPDKYLHPDV